MSRFLPFLLALGACAGGTSRNEATAENEARPVNAAAPAIAEGKAAPTENITLTIPGDPGLAEMSPSRRRAYEHGFRDCSAGRYNPDPYPEAYRIGCGAAQEGEGGGSER